MANGNKAAPLNLIVRMTFVGYRDGEAAFVFSHLRREPDMLIPPHDHSDNLHGGLAFCVFHPGTSLPHQLWAL